jgi:hypothetical protein
MHRHSPDSFKPARARLLFCVLALTSISAPCHAVIILEKNASEPIRGYLVEADEVRVVVDVLLPNGDIRRRILPRSSIAEMLEGVSRDKLAGLRSERPEDYRDYAEELAVKTNDPDARVTAIRLYQIAAYLAPDKLGRSCLLGMVSLARNGDEERKFRAAAYLIDREHNRDVLKSAGKGASRPDDGEWTAEQRQQLRTMLQALREQRPSDARSLARRPALAEPLLRISGILVPGDFAELRNGEPLPKGLMIKVLAAELSLEGAPGGRPASEPSEDRRPAVGGWANLADPQRSTPVPVLALVYLTEFDPRQCHFRNGKWEL